MIVIKPHHLIDIIKLYGAVVEHFVPDELFRHDFYKAANSIIENLEIQVQFTINGDDICRPCSRYQASHCTDSLDTISGYCSKEAYNRELDSRLINQLKLEPAAVYTVRQFLERLNKNKEIIYHVWIEEDNELTEKRNQLFQVGLKKLMNR